MKTRDEGIVGFELSRVPVTTRLLYQDKQAEGRNSRCPRCGRVEEGERTEHICRKLQNLEALE